MRRALRVLHILQYMHGYGAERQLAQLLARIHAPDLQVGVLTVYGESHDNDGFAFPVTTAGRRARRDYAFIARLLEGVRAFRPDIVHTHTLSGKYWGRFAALATGVETIVHTEHNPCDMQQSFAQRMASRVLNQCTSRVVTFFPEQAALLASRESIDGQRLALIPNGIDFQRLPHVERDSARAVLEVKDHQYLVMCVGRLTYQKHPELAMHALAALSGKRSSSAVLCFAGTGTLEPELRVLAKSLGIEDRVRFLGYRSDVASLLTGADLLLMTSRYEGMPLTLIEAMNARVPILTTPWLGSQTMLAGGAYGRIAAAPDAIELANAIASMREERQAVKGMAERARTHARSAFAIDRMVESHRMLYAELRAAGASAA